MCACVCVCVCIRIHMFVHVWVCVCVCGQVPYIPELYILNTDAEFLEDVFK